MGLNEKLLIGFVIILILLGGLGGFFITNLKAFILPLTEEIPSNIEELSRTSLLDDLAQQMRYYDEVLTQSARNYAFTGDKQWRARYYLFEDELEKTLNQAIEKGDEQEESFFEAVSEANMVLVQLETEAIQLIDESRNKEAIEILESEEYWIHKKAYTEELRNYFMKRGSVYDKVLESSTFTILLSSKKANETFKKFVGEAMMFSLAILVIFIFLGFLVTSLITTPIRNLTKFVGEVSKGNYDVKIDGKGTDEIGILFEEFTALAEKLKFSKEKLDRHQEELLTERKKLEDQVEERTKQIQLKANEAESTKRAILNIMEDVDETNKHLTEVHAQLQKNVQELRKLDLQKDQFISIAAHELKTPLTSIQGFSDLLAKQTIIENPKLRSKYLSIIHKDSRNLGNLISNIMELSRMDLGTLKLAWQKVDLQKFMKDVKDQMNIIITKAGYQSQFEAEQNLPEIEMDRDKAFQVVTNLINNAVKYAGKGTISFTIKRQGENIQFLIEDTGEGISKKSQAKIFERFYQIESHLTRSQGGTGLGLSLCKGFIEAMGGKIWVESELGKGTKFFFTLPISRSMKPKEEVELFKES